MNIEYNPLIGKNFNYPAILENINIAKDILENIYANIVNIVSTYKLGPIVRGPTVQEPNCPEQSVQGPICPEPFLLDHSTHCQLLLLHSHIPIFPNDLVWPRVQ